jgi:DHA2 family multidrug resistance protein
MNGPTPESVVEYGLRRTLVVAAVMLAALLQLADTTIVNVVLPTIDGSLGASTTEGTWFVTAYIIANIVVLPLSPFLASVFGRKNYFAFSIAGFTIMSAFCGMAHDTTSEIIYRFLQGAFGGGLMVPAQQIMRDTFPQKELGKSQSLFGLAVVLGPTIGPTLGGLLTDAFSWNWVFYINILPGTIAAVLAFLYLRDPGKPQRIAFDGIGVALLAVGLGSLQYVLEEGERNDWFDDPIIRVCALIAVLALVSFAIWELRIKSPAVALRVLTVRPVATTVAIAFVGGFVLYGLFIIQPEYTQTSLGFTTTLSGIFMMIRAATVLAFYPLTTWLVSRKGMDLRLVVGVGLAMYSLSAIWLSQLTTTTADFAAFVPAQMIGGFGLALFFVPLNVVLLQAIEPQIIASSLALQRLFQQLGGSVASAGLVTFADRQFAVHDSSLRGSIRLAATPTQTFVQHGLAHHASLSRVAVTLAHLVAAQDEVMALADATAVVGVIGLLSVPLVLCYKRHRAPQS